MQHGQLFLSKAVANLKHSSGPNRATLTKQRSNTGKAVRPINPQQKLKFNSNDTLNRTTPLSAASLLRASKACKLTLSVDLK